ncbi:MAG TPA: RDD family protein [Longimicrobium sp.]|jgi:uncharacterized RDD family membrane protein YckC
MDTQATPHEIYLGRGGDRSGPYTMDQVRDLVGEGRFSPGDWAWYPGAPQWIEIRGLPGLALSSLPRPPGYQAPLARTATVTRFAGFWIRFAAILIDSMVLLIPLKYLRSLLIEERTGDPAADLWVNLASLALTVFVHLAYRSAFHASPWQATIGKRAVGIQVTDLQGRRITFDHATGRCLAEFVSGWTLGIGYVMAGLSSRKQALHDKIAGTLVLYR